MTIKLTSLRIDVEREKKGDWIPYPDWPGVEFNVSSMQLPEFQTALSKMNKRLAKAFKDTEVPEHIRTVERGKLFASILLHDWRGLDEKYTPELAAECLSQWGYRDLINAVGYCCLRIGMSDAEFLEDAGKNFVPPSDGGSKDRSKPTG